MRNVLVLGFYDRGNAGDEMYKIAIPQIFRQSNAKFTFMCIDDIDDVNATPLNMSAYECLIFGGGDIINSYFMEKAARLLATYTGRVYAFSVGIPYSSDTRYLRLFDHVFVRSSVEYAIASDAIGERNVTRIPDASFVLYKVGDQKPRASTSLTLKVGICLAQPVFHNNSNAADMIEAIARSCSMLYVKYPNIEFHLVPFNTNTKNASECDHVVNQSLFEVLKACDACFPVHVAANTTPMTAYNTVENMDIICGMRFHSVVFGIISKRHVVPLYSSSKIDRFHDDFKNSLFPGYKLDVDANDRPIHIDSNILYKVLDNCIQQSKRNYYLSPYKWDDVNKILFSDKKYVDVLATRTSEHEINPDIALVYAYCKSVMTKYLGVTSSTYDDIVSRIGPVPTHKSYIDIARILCYCITRTISSPYIWGLSENMQKSDFSLHDAISYIYYDFAKQQVCARASASITCDALYYPKIFPEERRLFLYMDPIFQASDYTHHHRSGWAYVVGGLMNLDANTMGRVGTDAIMLDTYVDRTFHWSKEVLKTIGKIPYTRAWIGIVHHTFDTTHSTYNCVTLFENPEFLSSLRFCKGLIALSQYLAGQLKSALASIGFHDVPVTTIYHPMEPDERKFTMRNFIDNQSRKVVQIGAWLRDPYGIYNVPLYKSNNVLALQKCAINGTDMKRYFPVDDFADNLHNFLYSTLETSFDTGISGNRVCDTIQNSVNKFNTGMYKQIIHNMNSVTVIERLDNSEYDVLLSENIVYLKLVDCSAVNTILECMDRNTPVIVNRHPALEELLGSSYPGFYEDDAHAAVMLNTMSCIEKIHNHMRRLDKTRLQLSTFIKGIQDFASGIGQL
jgi:polysaccharide pyruvyl transferase WcaK-like protein